MLQLLLTAQDGGTAWRHGLGAAEARVGWACVGPLGLAKHLGRLHGFRAEPAPQPERIAAYAARLAALDDGARSYSRSRANDPWGVAAFLLALRDRLRASGWDGGTLTGSPRVADLAAAERLEAPGLFPVPAGLADLYARLLVAIEGAAAPEPLELRVAAPDAALDEVVLRVLAALEQRGARVEREAAATAAAPATTSLGRLQRAMLSSGGGAPGPALARDGSLLVLEADSPWEAAELVAAYACRRSLDGATWVTGRDLGPLHAALARHGLPALGGSEPSRWRPALQVLPLRLALAFAPRDPYRAAELLMLPVSPIPSEARRLLLDALLEQPAVGSRAWNAAIEEASARAMERARAGAPDDPERAAHEADTALRARIDAWFGGALHGRAEGIPAAEAIHLCENAAGWAEGRGRAQDDGLVLGAARIARTLCHMLAQQPAGSRLTPLQLEQLHDLAVADGLADGHAAGEAGRAALAVSPEAALPGAAEVVWWGFLDGDACAPEPWTAAEREALAGQGVRLPAPGARRTAEAEDWRRPVLAAAERLVLVRWRLEGTEPTVAHPLGDEIAARFAGALAPCTLRSEDVLAGRAPELGAAVSDRAPSPEVSPRATLRLPAEALSTDRLSPSSLERLFGCPLAWALRYAARLERRGMAAIPSGNRLLGTFAHAILEDLLHGPEQLDLAAATPDEAAAWAERAFDARVALEAAPLVAPGAEVEHHRARTVVREAARALFGLVQRGGWRVVATEQEVEGELDGAALGGSADLVLEKGGQRAVLDLKFAKPRYFREKLEEGQALQLALYAELLRTARKTPPAGYFLINEGELYTADRGAFPGARELDGPSLAETLAGARAALRYWRGAFGRGLVPARREALREEADHALSEEVGTSPPAGGPGAIDPPCLFCEYGALCGVELREVAR